MFPVYIELHFYQQEIMSKSNGNVNSLTAFLGDSVTNCSEWTIFVGWEVQSWDVRATDIAYFPVLYLKPRTASSW